MSKGLEAKETLKHFTDETVFQTWNSIFESLEQLQTENIFSKGEEYYPVIIREIYDAWNYHCRKNIWKIDFFDNYERFTGYSFEKITGFCMNYIIKPIKRIRIKLRHKL
jgi:hypothetical protein